MTRIDADIDALAPTAIDAEITKLQHRKDTILKQIHRDLRAQGIDPYLTDDATHPLDDEWKALDEQVEALIAAATA